MKNVEKMKNLLQNAKSGDSRALDAFIAESKIIIEDVIRKHHNVSTMDRQDAVSDSLLNLNTAIEKGQIDCENGNLIGYIVRIAKNATISILRKSSRYSNIDDTSILDRRISMPESEESDNFENYDLRLNFVLESINLLSSIEQKVIRLFFAEKENQEISEELSISSAYVRRLKFTAIQKLQQICGPYRNIA